MTLGARREKEREQGGVIRSRAALVAFGIDWDGRRQVIGVDLADPQSATAWRGFLLGMKKRGLRGVRPVVSDDHAGLKRAAQDVLSEAAWQRRIFCATRSTICRASTTSA